MLLVIIGTMFISASNGNCPKTCTCEETGHYYGMNCTSANLTDILYDFTTEKNNISFEVNNVMSVTNLKFTGYRKVKYLKITGRRILHIDDMAFINLSDLLELYLHDTDIEHISKDVFTGLRLLQRLSLHKNQISTIDKDAFYHLYNLVELNLTCNRLTYIEAGLLKTLKNLQTLCLSTNRISHIDHNSFEEHNKLQTITLDNNKLSSFDSDLFADLPNLDLLDIRNNTFNCNCNITKLAKKPFNLRAACLLNESIVQIDTKKCDHHLEPWSTRKVVPKKLTTTPVEQGRLLISINFKVLRHNTECYSVLTLTKNRERFRTNFTITSAFYTLQTLKLSFQVNSTNYYRAYVSLVEQWYPINIYQENHHLKSNQNNLNNSSVAIITWSKLLHIQLVNRTQDRFPHHCQLSIKNTTNPIIVFLTTYWIPIFAVILILFLVLIFVIMRVCGCTEDVARKRAISRGVGRYDSRSTSTAVRNESVSVRNDYVSAQEEPQHSTTIEQSSASSV